MVMEGVVSAEILMLRKSLADAQDVAALAVQNALETSERLLYAQAEEARVKAINSELLARNALLELQVQKMRRAAHGPSSERSQRLIDQLELAYEELEASATEDEIAAQAAAAKTTRIESFERKRATRRAFPDHLPTERVVIPSATSCSCCGSDKLTKLGEHVTQTLEKIPARHKIIETVRERFSCRECETIMQPPAPFHVTPRGMFGPHFLASLAFEKFGTHNPLNRQRDRYAQEGIELSLSTLADNIGAVVSAVRPLFMLLDAHVLGAERLHADDTTVPRLAKYKTDIARIWTYVRDDTPFAGRAPPAALFYTRVTGKASAPGLIWQTGAAFSRPITLPAITRCSNWEDRVRLRRTRVAGRTHAATCSSSPISQSSWRERKADLWSSRRWRSKRCSAST